MGEQRQDEELEPIYNISVPIYDVALKTHRERWTIETGSERGSGKSVLGAQHEDYDDEISEIMLDDIYLWLSLGVSYRTREIIRDCKPNSLLSPRT